MPPMIGGIDARRERHGAAGGRREAAARSAWTRSAVSGVGGRDLGADDVADAPAGARDTLGEQSGRITRRSRSASSSSSLADDRQHARPARRSRRRRRACAAPARPDSAATLRSVCVARRSSVAKSRELRVDAREIGLLLERDVEQGAGVTGGGSSVGHGFPGAHWSLRQVSQARNTVYTITFDELDDLSDSRSVVSDRSSDLGLGFWHVRCHAACWRSRASASHRQIAI